MKDIELPISSWPWRFTFNENLPDERRDGAHGSRHGEQSRRRSRHRPAVRVYAFTDRPDFLFARQMHPGSGGEIREHIIELADQALIRAEDDGADRLAPPLPVRLARRRIDRSASCRQTTRPSSTVRS